MIYNSSSTAPIPGELYAGDLQRAIACEAYTHEQLSIRSGLDYMNERHRDQDLGRIEVSARIGFAATLATHAATHMTPYELQETMEPVIAACDASLEQVISAYEGDIWHTKVWTVTLWRDLLRQIILFSSMSLYPPENKEAETIRLELAQDIYQRSASQLPQLFDAYTEQQKTAELASQKELLSGVMQEITIIALINKPNDPKRLAVPALFAEDNIYKTDLTVWTYDTVGSFNQHVQSSAHHPKSKRHNNRRRHEAAKRAPYLATIYPSLLGNAVEGKTRSDPAVKTWETTRAIIADITERPASSANESSSDLADYLWKQCQSVLNHINAASASLYQTLWHIPKN